MKKNYKKPNKKELAEMKVRHEMGESPSAIAKDLGRSHHTTIKYLNSDVFTRPDMKEIVEQLRNKEIADLTVIGAKARQRIHDIFDNGKPALIPTVAAMDRTFQQRRLLEGKSTENVHNLTAYIQAVHAPGKKWGSDDTPGEIEQERDAGPDEVPARTE
jgi:hypothetical protein